ncbi:hypothetical protein N7463_001511 [Penicillium fimorum]|uniref:Short-chain dehydrogenase/reductase SDR n=1 Tax=Penicillium fimorum TaxID=1882269 RepID=A0A9W9Y7L1_9EURO|nr:hypothetical protein N7463_001511 [Penicillium fimorum]
MPQTFYNNTGRATNPSTINTSTLKGKTAVITGACSGLGYCYSKAFIAAGCFVVLADLKPPPEDLDESQALFVQCNVTVWEEQLAVFEAATARSPTHKIDIVIANAGIAGPDVLAGLNDEIPQPPQTTMIDVNVTGVLYTTKLAGWYFTRHHRDPLHGCLILISSIMGYIDTQSSAIYGASKFAVRGMMCCIRRKGILRVNCIAPWLIPTPIMNKDFLDNVRAQFQDMGLDLTSTQDAVTAVLRIASDYTLNGHTFAIVPRELAASGYMDLGLDDLKPESPAGKLQAAASSIYYSKFGHALS